MFQSLLTNLAKKYLGLVDKEANALALTRQDEQIESLQMQVVESQKQNHQLMLLCGEMKNRYPEVWLDGDVADGLFRLPDLKMAVEFYREENKLCVVIPLAKAQGHNPLQFIPKFLEKDPDLSIEGGPDKMNGKVWVYKIPILGWNDALDMTRNIKDEQPNYELDGSIREKPKTFRAKCGVEGLMRRVRSGGKTSITLWFMADLLQDPKKYPMDMLLPKGNLEIVGDVKEDHYGEGLNKTWCFTFRVKEAAAHQLQAGEEIKLLPAQE